MLEDGVLWFAFLVLVAASVVAAETIRIYGFPIALAVAAAAGCAAADPSPAASATVFLLSMFVLSLEDPFTRI